MKNDSGNFWRGFLIGATIGAGAGLLLAPASGLQTRARLRGAASRAGERAATVQAGVQETVGETAERSRGIMGDLRERISIAVQAGREAAREKRAELQEEVAEVTEPKPSM